MTSRPLSHSLCLTLFLCPRFSLLSLSPVSVSFSEPLACRPHLHRRQGTRTPRPRPPFGPARPDRHPLPLCPSCPPRACRRPPAAAGKASSSSERPSQQPSLQSPRTFGRSHFATLGARRPDQRRAVPRCAAKPSVCVSVPAVSPPRITTTPLAVRPTRPWSSPGPCPRPYPRPTRRWASASRIACHSGSSQ